MDAHRCPRHDETAAAECHCTKQAAQRTGKEDTAVSSLALQVFLRTKGITELSHLCMLSVNLILNSSREKAGRQEGNIPYTAS